jgi:hypothetical protein
VDSAFAEGYFGCAAIGVGIDAASLTAAVVAAGTVVVDVAAGAAVAVRTAVAGLVDVVDA